MPFESQSIELNTCFSPYCSFILVTALYPAWLSIWFAEPIACCVLALLPPIQSPADGSLLSLDTRRMTKQRLRLARLLIFPLTNNAKHDFFAFFLYRWIKNVIEILKYYLRVVKI